MSKTHQSILEAVGRTPLVRLARVGAGLPCPVYGKAEFLNPGSSVKDRLGLALVEKAEAEGILRPGESVIIEATAGNTGVGLALAAAVKGYRCIFVLPDKMSVEKIQLLQAYGAEVVIVPTDVPPDSPMSYNGTARRLLQEIPGAWHADQFHNMANPEIHYRTTGPEIWEQTEGKVTCFVAGIGTGGTISGVGRFLKEKNPRIRIIGADPLGSVLSGSAPQAWKVEGIGEDYVPQTLNSSVVDDWVQVSDRESFLTGRRLAREEGMLVGGSAGTAVAGALRYAQRLGPDDLVVAILPDSGRSYMSKMYNDDWMRENGYLQEDSGAPATAGEALLALGPAQGDLITLSPDLSLGEAARTLRERNVSQAPVLQNGEQTGAVHEATLARALREGTDPDATVRAVMGRPLPEVEPVTSLDEVYRLLLAGHGLVIVRDGESIRGCLSQIDLVEFWGRKKRKTI